MAEDVSHRVVRMETRQDSHETECARRYASLEKAIEGVLAGIENVHSRMSGLRADANKALIRAQWTVLGGACLLIAWLFAKNMGWI